MNNTAYISASQPVGLDAFGTPKSLSQGLPKPPENTDICTRIYTNRKITVMK